MWFFFKNIYKTEIGNKNMLHAGAKRRSAREN